MLYFQHPDHVWNKSPLIEPPLPASYAGNFEEDEEEAAALPNLCQQLSLIEQSGIGKAGHEQLDLEIFGITKYISDFTHIKALAERS